MAEEKKKKARKKRDTKKYPGLDKTLFSKIKQEQWDLDYIEQLSPEDKKFMSKFMEEFVGARLNGKGKKLHKTKKLTKDCFDRNNARNRDIYAIARATGTLYEYDPYLDEQSFDIEDKWIQDIDGEGSSET